MPVEGAAVNGRLERKDLIQPAECYQVSTVAFAYRPIYAQADGQ